MAENAFAVESRFRPFHLVAPGFVAAAAAPGRVDTMTHTDASPDAPFAAVEVDVTDSAGAVVLAGLASPAGDHVLAVHDSTRGRVGIEVRRGGRARTVRRRDVILPPAHRFGFVLCENRVTVLADTGTGWRPLLSARRRVTRRVDLRDPSVLAEHRYAWGARASTGRTGTSAATVSRVSAGLFGMAGIRDPHLVQHADGTPYVRDGKAYLTATCAGLGFFQQAHWGVFTLDLADPTRLEQVAQIYFRRDGLLLGDHAGQLVRDDEEDRWLVLVSSWGDFSPRRGVHVRHTESSADLLRGVHVLETDRTPMPTTAGSWDPSLTRVDGRWHLAFVESPSQKPFDFHPALAVADGPAWTDGLRMVGAATDRHACEGPVLARVDGEWRVLASDGEAREYPVFDLRMTRTGSLAAPYLTNIPHPQLVPLPEGDELLVTFDGTPFGPEVLGYGTHGDVVVMRRRGS